MFLEISQNSQENTCARASFLIKLQGSERLWHRCFPVNFVKILRIPFLTETSFGCFQIESYRNIVKSSRRLLAFTLYKTFLNTKRGLKLVSLTPYILLTGQISLAGCLYFVRYWTICVL